MHDRTGNHFLRDESGAVAATYAMALTALIVIAGVGFDYGRLATMDSELQNGADQAALAGATQLDGKSGACSRAATAAVSLVTNKTVLANDASTITVASETACDSTGTVKFWQKADGTGIVTNDAEAHFIELTVATRTVDYAFTPIVNLMQGSVSAGAMAGLGSSVCNVPPVFMCNPAEEVTVGADFDASGLVGHGVKLLAGSPTVPGNFGFLDAGGGGATPDLARMIGYDSVPFDCAPISDVGLNPGQKDVVFNAFNTRFDIDTNGANTCPNGGTCSAATNTRKDLVRKNQCGTNGGSGWQEPPTPYRPTSASPITSGYPETMGYPRDLCHAWSFDGSCSYLGSSPSTVGNKSWDRDAYFKVNYGWATDTAWQSNSGLPSDVSRYRVYEWEKANPSNLADQNIVGGLKAQSTPKCRAAQNPAAPDRRRFTMAVVNCKSQATKINGNKPVEILKWVDVFLVEPAFDRGSGASKRTTGDQVYVEIIGPTSLAGGGSTAAQLIRRDVPYLVR